MMRWLKLCFLAAVAWGFVLNPAAPAAESKRAHAAWLKEWRADNPVWRGVHVMVQGDAQAAELGAQLTHLKSVGVNVVVAEVDYAYQFKSDPGLHPSGGITRERAQALAGEARALGIRLIPQLNCLGHQSWGRHTAELLTQHPEFDETPGQYPNNTNIYCRSWCPQNPEVNKVVFALIDDLADGFDADAFHVGMDEVFIIASEHCPRCKGGDPAKLFAKAVNDLHGHIVGTRKLEMLMWGDRLLDAKALGYSEWEAAKNGTAGAIDLIPKDIVICDWHYGQRTNYPSVPLLLERGFRVWPSGWQPLAASKAFSAFAKTQKSDRLLGYLATTWGKVKLPELAEWPPILQVLHDWE